MSQQQSAFPSEQFVPLSANGLPKAKTDKICGGVDEIPFEGIEQIGSIFVEGQSKYGRDNWKGGVHDIEYQRERTRHAIRHLQLWANGDRSENHLAKVAWFCVTQIWIEVQQSKK